MKPWQPGDPLYTDRRMNYASPGVGEIRRIFDVLDLDQPMSMITTARWPAPHPIHDLDAQEATR